MRSIINDPWIIANTYSVEKHRFAIKDPLMFEYGDQTIWKFLDDGQMIDRTGRGIGTWQADAQQPPNRLIVSVHTPAGGSSIEFINDDFGIFWSAGQAYYFLAREHAFHPEW